jgi:uncharacterized protein (TIGR00251 family)
MDIHADCCAKTRPGTSPLLGYNQQIAILRVHVVPNAKIDGVVGEDSHGVKIKLHAAAVDGKANAALIRFLAGQLGVPRHSIVLECGRRSRDKLIRVDGLTEGDVRRRLLAKNRNESPVTP